MQSRHLIVAAAVIMSSAACAASAVSARPHSGEQVQISPPEVRRTEPPSVSASADELEGRGDTLRGEKAYLDALDYYRAALAKKPGASQLFNKAGITELLLHRFREAAKDFERAIKYDHDYADAHNNLGVIHYLQKKYGKAIKEYEKAIKARNDSASFYSNCTRKSATPSIPCYICGVPWKRDTRELAMYSRMRNSPVCEKMADLPS
ncbi:MAG: hypothetical protein DMG91_01400 [Acidobacteria bacterium]|nr:MAG: hypothetical protein DMG91_01400 [Acidobacteriota bacterium]